MQSKPNQYDAKKRRDLVAGGNLDPGLFIIGYRDRISGAGPYNHTSSTPARGRKHGAKAGRRKGGGRGGRSK